MLHNCKLKETLKWHLIIGTAGFITQQVIVTLISHVYNSMTRLHIEQDRLPDTVKSEISI